jgi:hypothetical protein
MKNVKVHILLIAFFVYPFFSISQVRTDLFRQNLKGKVHKEIISDYTPVNGSEKTKEEHFSGKLFFEFDEQGYLIRMNKFNNKNELTINRIFKTDENGKRLASFDYDNDDRLMFIDSFRYDSNGNRILDIMYNLDYTLRMKMMTTYDNSGAITAFFEYDSRGKLIEGYKFKVDNNGQRIESRYIQPDSTEGGTNVYKYSHFDRLGNWSKCVTFFEGHIFSIETLKIEYY